DILWLNQLPEDAILQPGELVRVRLAPDEAPPPTPTPILYHSVRSGQTLWEIAITYGLSLDELLALNQIDQDAILQLGDRLLVRPLEPTPLPTEPPTATPQPATPTAIPTETATAVSSTVSAQTSQALAQATTPEPQTETAVAQTGEDQPAIVSIVTGLVVGLLVIGLLAVAVLRSELI
ncbi:MAG: LysM peptidoglycan-binding domain-containing protein, partial [Anaerolineales bacterium]|nr:LysM peptidoglycan-binding domain-containing protein [Anaerolineales bacterium]